jgi:hypothetical protein
MPVAKKFHRNDLEGNCSTLNIQLSTYSYISVVPE